MKDNAQRKVERNSRILEMRRREGKTLAQIADHFGICTKRVTQIINMIDARIKAERLQNEQV